MGIKKMLRLRKHKSFLLDRVLELKHNIFKKALLDNKIDEVDRTLFIKYNERLKRLN